MTQTILLYTLTFGFGMLAGAIWHEIEVDSPFIASAIIIASSGLLLIGMKLATL